MIGTEVICSMLKLLKSKAGMAAVFFLLSLPVIGRTSTDSLYNCTTDDCNDDPSEIMQRATHNAAEQLAAYYEHRHSTDGFNGCVMIAKDGTPIYSAAIGYADYADRDTLTLASSFQLASVTKTFTASAVLLLAEKGFLSLDDSIQKFFPQFPYPGITVKLLLSHRSGLPDYTHWDKYFIGTDVQYLTNDKVLQLLIDKKPAVRCRPDRVFLYCNTNYALLASIIEKVSGMSYPKFMHDVIFEPLGMANTFVFTPDDTIHQRTVSYKSGWHKWYDDVYDGVYGDKGIYSSVADMLKWDNALRAGIVLSKKTLQEAYKPRSLDRYSFVHEKNKNYGYGWRMIKQPDKSYLIYHNGYWHGSNNVFARDLNNGYTVIVLGNKANFNNYHTQAVWTVLNELKTFDNLAENTTADNDANK